MSVVGIDFGTRNCVISQAKRGAIETVLNEGSKRQTHSLVSFQGKQRFMGEQAVPLVSSNYKNTISEIKRMIGRSWSDPQVQKDLAFLPNKAAYKELDGDRIGIQVHYQDEVRLMEPEDVCAMMIGSLKRTAEFSNEGRAVKDTVFSVPAFWTDRQRRSFLNSARIANVDVLGLINDGTATALSYGIWKSASNQFDATNKDYVMFVDMGYAAFQVTIAAFMQGKLEIVASACDPNLGGRDLDMALAKHFAAQFKEKHKADPLSDPKALLKLLSACEKLKQTLTPEGVSKANLNVEYLLNEIDFNSSLTLEEFDEILAPLVERVVAPLEEAMESSGLTMDKLSAVEIVGGSTRVRSIKKRIAEVLELDQTKTNYGLSTTQNADECVSRGCALRCAMLSPQFRVKEFVVTDAVQYPITVTWEQSDGAGPMETESEAAGEEEAAGENSVKLFAKGCEVPKVRRIVFRRGETFEVAAGYDAECKDAFSNPDDMSIGTFRISGIPEHSGEGLPRIRVDFKQDEFGLFECVRADYMQPVDEEPKTEAKEDGAKGGEEGAKADEGKEEGKKDDSGKPKATKKFKPIKLKVEASFNQGRHIDEVMNARAQEEEFSAHDRLMEETSAARNKLEGYVYAMRDKIDSTLKEFGTESERSEFASQLSQLEDWLYDEGSDEIKKVYVDKLAEVRAIGDRFEKRASEQEERPKAADRLRDEISSNLAIVNSPDEQYDHIGDDERAKVREYCEDAENWLQEKLNEQADKALFEDPIVSAADILARMNTVNVNCRPIVTKRRPAPAKKQAEEKKTDEAKEGAAADEGGDAAAEDGDAASKAEAKKQEDEMDID